MRYERAGKMKRRCRRFLRGFLLLALAALSGCYPALRYEPRAPREALERIRFFYPVFRDDLDRESLIRAVNMSLRYLERANPDTTFEYGSLRLTRDQVTRSLETFLEILRSSSDPQELDRMIRDRFLVFRAKGRVGNRKVLFTGYYEPVFQGSLQPDETYRFPIYRRPPDLLKIDLSRFHPRFSGQSIVARIADGDVVPYYSRTQIDLDKALAGRGLEIAWLKDPLDVTFLQIQGSGRILLPDGSSLSVGYAASNGRPYRSIGRYLVENDLMRLEDMSMQNIRRFLREHPELLHEVLNHNPSYVFFRKIENGPFGNINVPLTPGRSIALDRRLFPAGALAFIRSRKPRVDRTGRITGWEPFSRFVLNQDTGGAIRGAGRADLFWGSGTVAEVSAGHMKEEGDLYILVRKP
ncbi:MAG: MltA domain-containing protein [Deltaproteobacteria bacterium]|nr:MltA domain-containing protein [Deltaproteobacteria bacterium]MBW1923290.1 MltA domain-containing protein [Deltaproteobacteria bacterium]MBW1950985.1 MltA domain-containing protein [Deltaproteobacteria bacterium]MBW2009303.1 MltA domain-containing protein [Deltaproteobacteria bacterium]MBW2103321.1 MltA domain-containing protein [Deltaproteobacteria bacterium]